MASGDVAVAGYNGDTVSRKSTTTAPSRRSIVDRIAPANGEIQTPISNTDAVLRSRRSSTSGSHHSGSTRRKGANNLSDDSNAPPPQPLPSHFLAGKQNKEQQANGYLPIPAYADGEPAARKDSDNRSNASRRSARGVITNLLSRSKSRASSQEPDADDAKLDEDGRRRSLTGTSARRLSRRIGINRKGSSASINTNGLNGVENGQNGVNGSAHDSLPPPVPAIPKDVSRPGPPSRKASTGVVKDASVPVHPSQQNGASNGAAKEAEKDDEEPESKGLLGGAVAAVAGAGALAGGAAAALASKVTGTEGEAKPKGASKGDNDGEDSEEEFYDADLADIAEREDEEEEDGDDVDKYYQKRDQDRKQQDAAKKSQTASSQANIHRHRGLSEGEGVALGAGVGAGAAGAAFARKREGTDQSAASGGRPASIRSQSSRTGAPQQLRGTAAARRRSGSAPLGGDVNTSSADQKARNETPFYVREKSARVRKLTFDDVQMTEEEMRHDISEARKALHLFLNSRMIEAEAVIAKYSDQKLYYALGDALIAVIKGFMTFEPEDLAKAISYCKDALHMASLLRKQTNTVSNFGRFVRGTGHGPNTMANMSIVQRHAELIYAESLLLKAVMGILYSGDFIGFVAEALNMRNAYGIYRSLSKYVEWADEKAGGREKTIDEDFRSGVFLGNGLISMILGLLPGKVLKIMEVFGYTGDTQWALKTLARAGEWTKDSDEPGMAVEKEGIRRQVCDMGILLYHLVISTFLPVAGVDIDFADKVLHYNLERYPQGIFFLYFSGRLYSTQSLAERAIVQFAAARDVQKEYVQLQHICVWDMSLCHMSLTQFDKAYECFKTLLKESNWSKCVYSYGEAVNLYSSTSNKEDARRVEASKKFAEVPGKMQRIAGKSIPMEKFCARKAKKFLEQERLLLPALEFSYVYHCFTNAPAYSLSDNQLVDISEALQELNQVQDPSEYYSGADEYWDDYCLAHFLRGVTLRYIAYPEKHAKSQESESPIPASEAAEQAEISLRNVIESSHRLSIDHYLCYFAHYELGRLYASQNDKAAAKEQFELIMSGKTLEATTRTKGKYSMQNMCTLRTNGALMVL